MILDGKSMELYAVIIYPVTLLNTKEYHGQCCQLSNFDVKFSNFFFQRHLATNLAILKIYLETFSNFW